MATFNIIENVENIHTFLSELVELMVTNLTIKGIGGISTNNTLTELVGKILEVKYQPIPRNRRSRSITPLLDIALTSIKTRLEELHIRFRLNLGVMGVPTPEDATLTFLANKILDIKVSPQYNPYPNPVIVRANGEFGEFFFETSDSVKVDFSASNGFTLDRTTGIGPATFIVRVSGQNNTTTSKKTGTLTIRLDNGKYPDVTIGIEQSPGVQYFTLTNTTSTGNLFPADGEGSVSFGATYSSYWNGVLTGTQIISGNSLTLSGSTPGFTINGGILTAANRTTIAGPLRSISVTPSYAGLTSNPITISQVENKIEGYGDADWYKSGGNGVVNFPAGYAESTYWDMQYNKLYSSGSKEFAIISGDYCTKSISLNVPTAAKCEFNGTILKSYPGLTFQYPYTEGTVTLSYVIEGVTLSFTKTISKAANYVTMTTAHSNAISNNPVPPEGASYHLVKKNVRCNSTLSQYYDTYSYFNIYASGFWDYKGKGSTDTSNWAERDGLCGYATPVRFVFVSANVVGVDNQLRIIYEIINEGGEAPEGLSTEITATFEGETQYQTIIITESKIHDVILNFSKNPVSQARVRCTWMYGPSSWLFPDGITRRIIYEENDIIINW